MTRVLFIGTAQLAVASLRALLACSDLELVGVVTQPDRRQGRQMQLKPSPVKEAATAAGLVVLQPEKIRDEVALSEIRALSPDLIVVAAYGQILPKALLDIPKHGCLNVHTSLLPRYRGAAPIQWSILNGDVTTGVTLMLMDPGLDTGPILSRVETPIESSDTSQTLHDRLAELGGELLVQVVREWLAGRLTPQPQPSEGTCYARKIEKQDGLLDWSLPAAQLWNRVRGLVPWPGAFFHHPTGSASTLKVWEARPEECSLGRAGEVIAANGDRILVRCGEGALRMLVMQREGGKRLGAREFLTGYSLKVGEQLRQQTPPGGVC
jgi:methionyl-tRNA formyltransferase